MNNRQVSAWQNQMTFAIGENGIIAKGDSLKSHYLICADNLKTAFNMAIGDTKELDFVSPNYSVRSPMRYTAIVTRIR